MAFGAFGMPQVPQRVRSVTPTRTLERQRVAKDEKVPTKTVEMVPEMRQKTTVKREPGYQRQTRPDGQVVDVPGTWDTPQTVYEQVMVPREKTVMQDRVTYEDKLVPKTVNQVTEQILPMGQWPNGMTNGFPMAGPNGFPMAGMYGPGMYGYRGMSPL